MIDAQVSDHSDEPRKEVLSGEAPDLLIHPYKRFLCEIAGIVGVPHVVIGDRIHAALIGADEPLPGQVIALATAVNQFGGIGHLQNSTHDARKGFARTSLWHQPDRWISGFPDIGFPYHNDKGYLDRSLASGGGGAAQFEEMDVTLAIKLEKFVRDRHSNDVAFEDTKGMIIDRHDHTPD